MDKMETGSNQETKTFVFGGGEKPTETNTGDKSTTEEISGKEPIIPNIEKETLDTKGKVIEPKKEVVEEKKSEIDNEEKKPLNISFKPKKETEENQRSQEKETLEITEQSVLKWLNDNGVKADKVSELSKKEELSESVAQFNKFVKETGRTSLKDFYNAQKDWSKEPKDATIEEFYKYDKNISDEDIKTRMELLVVTEDDEENLGSRELSQRKLDYNAEYNKALDFMNKITEEYNTPLENYVQQKAPTTEEIAQAYKPYWDNRDKSLAKLTDVEFSVDGIGDIKLNVTADQRQRISEITQTQETLVDRWTDKNGKIDTDRITEDTMWSIPEIRNEFITSMMEQAQALVLENFSKDKRNVTLGKEKNEKISNEAGSFQVIGNRESSNAGKPLI